jgi:hypothetical protein
MNYNLTTVNYTFYAAQFSLAQNINNSTLWLMLNYTLQCYWATLTLIQLWILTCLFLFDLHIGGADSPWSNSMIVTLQSGSQFSFIQVSVRCCVFSSLPDGSSARVPSDTQISHFLSMLFRTLICHTFYFMNSLILFTYLFVFVHLCIYFYFILFFNQIFPCKEVLLNVVIEWLVLLIYSWG